MRIPALRPLGLAALVLALAGACERADVEAADQEPAPEGPVVPPGMEGWGHLLGHNTPYDSRTNWKGQRQEGFVTLWHPNGSKQAEGSYDADGRRIGPWVFWFENGQKRWEGTYKADQVTGLERAWYDDGAPHYQATYVGGLLDGECSTWHPNGRLMWRGHFARGKPHGAYLAWSADGELDGEASGIYERGVKVGEHAAPPDGVDQAVADQAVPAEDR